MSFFTIEEISRTITIRNKKRISLLAALNEFSMLIFYQDKSYEHREIFSDKIIHEGKMEFVVTQIMKPMKLQADNNGRKQNISLDSYIGVLGQKDDNTIIFGILSIRSAIYDPYEVIHFQTVKQAQSINFHLIQSLTGYPFLMMVSMNIENGIMIQCFDFETNLWLQNVLHLGSKYLSYLTITIPNIGGNQQTLASLLFVANGQKSQSVHMACLGINRQKRSHSQINPNQEISQNLSNQKENKKIDFLFTREVKYQMNFTILGGYASPNGHLFMIGNSLTFKTKQSKQLLWQPQLLTINLSNLMMNNNLDPYVKFKDLKGFKIGKQIIVREYLGFVDNWMVFLVQNPIKSSIHKLSPQKVIQKQTNFDEQAYTMSSSKSRDLLLSCDSKIFLSYQLICEQYFEKLKDTPSVIKLDILKKIDKKMYYKNLLQKMLPQSHLNEAFLQSVTGLF